MMPGISAGSNQVGASETCTPQVSCPSAPAALAGPGDPASRVTAKRASGKPARDGAYAASRPGLHIAHNGGEPAPEWFAASVTVAGHCPLLVVVCLKSTCVSSLAARRRRLLPRTRSRRGAAVGECRDLRRAGFSMHRHPERGRPDTARSGSNKARHGGAGNARKPGRARQGQSSWRLPLVAARNAWLCALLADRRRGGIPCATHQIICAWRGCLEKGARAIGRQSSQVAARCPAVNCDVGIR